MAEAGTGDSKDNLNGTPAAAEGSENKPRPLKIKIKGPNMTELTIQVKRTAKLAKVFGAYAERVGRDLNELTFMFDGTRLSASTSIDQLDIDADEDEVSFDVMQHQVGGSP